MNQTQKLSSSSSLFSWTVLGSCPGQEELISRCLLGKPAVSMELAADFERSLAADWLQA